MTLVLIGFLGGLLTGISPCILPVLPVVFLGGASPDGGAARSRRRPFLVVAGLTLAFAVFTLFGTLVLSLLHLPGDLLRWFGLAALVLLGLALLVPPLERLLERPFSLLPQREVHSDRGGFVLGLALGAVFVPCAGPVLAAITVAGATGRIGAGTVALTLAFAIGCAIPLLGFALAGRRVLTRVRAFQRHQRAVRAVSGVVMIGLAVALTFNVTDVVQRIVPNYTEAVGNTLASGLAGSGASGGSGTSGAAAAPAAGGAVSLSACRTAAEYGGAGLQDCGPAPDFAGVSAWLNTPAGKPLDLAALKGKVVLVDFWAYSCINCQRELPHVEAWYRAYKDAGLVVVGVHTPEYAFEHDARNVAAGAKRIGLTFPIANDDAYGTWNAYGNNSWPAGYLIDATGRIRSVSIGEGGYAEEEGEIRTLLAAAHGGATLPRATAVPDTTPQDRSQTAETYLGGERARSYVGVGPYAPGTHAYSLPASLPSGGYALAGRWTITGESITADRAAELRLRYHASKVYLDVSGTGTLTVRQGGRVQRIRVSGAPNIYTVASSPGPADGEVTIGATRGLSAYSFTFG